MDMQPRLEKLRSAKFVGASALADAAVELLRSSGIEQERGTVSDFPDERTIRFYLSEGLIEVPEERRGSASLFSYRNLLQVLVVKKLQAEHFPIRKIREIVAGRSEEELEDLLAEDGSTKYSHRDPMTYLQGLLSTPKHHNSEIVASLSMPLMMAEMSPQESNSWRRVELMDGLELHIRDDFRFHDARREMKRLSTKILNVLSEHGTKPGKTEE
jgi:DNA-binding transcriptional MerR regulator